MKNNAGFLTLALIAEILASLFTAAAFAQTEEIVQPSNLSGWGITDFPLDSAAEFAFEDGPAGPPLGIGSLEAVIPSAGTQVILSRAGADYSQQPVSGLTAMSIDTYNDAAGGSTVNDGWRITLYIDADNDGTSDCRLEHTVSQPQGNEWATTDLLGTTWSGQDGCAGNQTLASFIAGNPDARFLAFDDPAEPAIRLSIGDSGSGFVGYRGNLDAVRIAHADLGDTVWNFEPLYTVGGNVSGLGAGAGLELGLNSTQTLVINDSGAFEFPDGLVAGTEYTVTIDQQPVDHFCTIANAEGTLVDQHVTDVDVECFVCQEGANTACLSDGRFQTRVSYDTAGASFVPSAESGSAGQAEAVDLASNTAVFSFYDSAQLDAYVKVIDGCVINDRFWVFAAAATDSAVDIQITDVVSGASTSYSSPAGQPFDTVVDTNALESCPTPAGTSSPTSSAEVASATRGGACGGTFCLQGGRYALDVAFETPFGGTSGQLAPATVTDHSATGYAFNPDDVEAVVTVIDGQADNGAFWFLASTASGLNLTYTLTDTLSGLTNEYVDDRPPLERSALLDRGDPVASSLSSLQMIVGEGQTAEYELVVTNPAPTSREFRASAPTPAGAGNPRFTCSAAFGAVCPASQGSGPFDESGTLVAGGELTFTLAFDAVDAEAGDTLMLSTTVETQPHALADADAETLDATTGIGVGPLLSLSPNPADFGEIRLGATSDPLTVTVSNPGDVLLNVTGLDEATGDYARTGDGTCGDVPFAIDPDQSCTLIYTFSPPLGEGGEGGQLIFLESDAPSSPDRLSLTGTGIESRLRLNLDPPQFSEVRVGADSDPLTVTVTSTGNTELNVTALTGASTPFSPAGGTCGAAPFSVDPGQSCTLIYTFSPMQIGQATQTLTLESDAPSSPDSFELAGAGIDPQLSLTPTTLDFQVVPQGQTARQTLTLTNAGTTVLSIQSISNPDAPFSIVSGAHGGVTASEATVAGAVETCTAPSTLEPDQSCAITVEFAPGAFSGTATSSIDIVSDASSSPDTITLRGSTPAISIPAMNHHGMLLLVLLLLIAAIVARAGRPATG